MKYESEILYDLMKRDGLLNPSQDNLPYESELKEKYVDEVKGAYPKVIDYRPEWMNYNLGYYIPADFPIESIENVTSGTVNNVVPYAFKSAILTGNTIKNLTLNKDIKFKQSWSGGLGTQSSLSSNSTRCSLEVDVEPNTTYSIYSTVELYIRQATADYTIIAEQDTWTTGFRQLTTTTNVYKLLIGLRKSDNSSYTDIQEAYGNIIVKGDYIIDDYFEDLKSVKMPVLTTTGKNLFDKNNVMKDKYISAAGEESSEVGTNRNATDFIQVKPNTSYLLSGVQNSGVTNSNRQFYVAQYNANKEIIVVTAPSVSSDYVKITTEAKTKYIRTTIKDDDLDRCQIEQSTQATPHEPYKSNILTVNEPIELRGIGDVQDTLDCLTGEMTERVGEIVLDGSENWSYNENLSTDALAVFSVYNDFGYLEWLGAGSILCDKFPITQKRATDNNAQEGIYDKDGWAGKNKIPLIINKDRLSSVSVDGLKLWLSNNQLKLQFKLQNKSIKTVDLTNVNQDGVPSTFRPFEGTMHIQTDGTPLKPLFNGEIPVEATTQNLASFVNLEGVERTVNEYEEIVGDDNNEQLL